MTYSDTDENPSRFQLLKEKMDAKTRDYLRYEISRRRLEMIRTKPASGEIAEIEMMQAMGEELTPEQEAILMAVKGISQPEITKVTGVTRHRQQHLRMIYGIKPAMANLARNPSPQEKARALDIIRQNPQMSSGEIEALVGIHSGTIRRWRRKLTNSGLTTAGT